MTAHMDSRRSRDEHQSELSSRPETALWDTVRKAQSIVSNGFVHRWANRRIPVDAFVVDAACGDGRLARVRGNRAYVGFDFVERLAHRARRFSKGAPVGVADIHSMPLREACADVVTCFEVLEHLDDPDHALAEFARVLRPGGKLLLSVPNDDGLKHRMKHDPHPLHQSTMDAGSIRGLVARHFRLDALAFRGVWLFTPGRVSVQVGIPAGPRLATNILVVATRRH